MMVVLGIQISTFAVLGVYFLTVDEVRLGVAQLLLAAVQGVIYSGGIR